MGSKAAMVVFTEESPKGAFQSVQGIDNGKSQLLAEKLLGAPSQEAGLLSLDLAVWPDAGVVCAASLSGFEVVCSRELARNAPSELTEQISRLAAGRNAYGVFMDSAEDWAAFAIWSGGRLVRSLSVRPDTGIIEDVGDRLPFEAPFWEGARPVRSDPGYSLPFHPIDFGNEALREFFGFILEGREDESCLDPEEVELLVFRVASQV